MANKRISDLPEVTSSTVGDVVAIDGTTTRKITVENLLGANLIDFSSKAAPSGAVVGTTDTQDLTNKTVNGLTVTASVGTLTIPNNASAVLRMTGNFTLNLTVSGATTPSFPSGTYNVVGDTTAQTLTNKTFDTAAASNTFKLNGSAVATAAQFTAALNSVVGDSGSGGTKGLVPAPASGDASAGKFLKADGTWALPAGLPTKYWSGFQHSNNVTTPNTKIDIAAGVARDGTDAINIITSSGTVDCGSTGLNGLDTGALANSTWYYTFAICKADGSVPGYLASSSSTAPTLPATYTKFRRIGSFKTNGSAQIIAFKQVNNQWWWVTPPRDVNATAANGGTLNTLIVATLSVPRVLGVWAKVAVTAFPASASPSALYVSPTWAPLTSANGGQMLGYNTTQGGNQYLDVQVDAAAQINYFPSNTPNVSQTVVFDTIGWRDDL